MLRGSRAAPASQGQLLPSSCLGRRLLPRIVSFLAHYQLAADFVDSPRTGCSPFPRPRRWASQSSEFRVLTSKTTANRLSVSPCAGTPPLKRSVGTHGAASNPACRTRCPKEPHAQRSWHLQRSLPAQSEDLRTEAWLAESLRRRTARPTALGRSRAASRARCAAPSPEP
jgi:hypothetical protein